MKLKLQTVSLLQWILILGLAMALLYMGRDELHLLQSRDDPDAVVAPRVALQDGMTVVTVAEEAQKAAGIVLEPVAAMTWQEAAPGYALVLSPQPLLQWRSRWQGALQEAASAAALRRRAVNELDRTRQLYQDDFNASRRALQAAESDAEVTQARATAAEAAVEVLRQELRAQWGETMAAAMMLPAGGVLSSVLQGDEVLLQVVSATPSEAFGMSGTQLILPERQGGQNLAVRFVSASPQSDALLPGKTWFWRTASRDLRLGTRLRVQAQGAGKGVTGFRIPEAAVVWHVRHAWIYRKLSESRFARQEIDASRPVSDGFFVEQGFKAGDPIVVTGAQLLMSEEGRLQIRNENQE